MTALFDSPVKLAAAAVILGGLAVLLWALSNGRRSEDSAPEQDVESEAGQLAGGTHGVEDVDVEDVATSGGDAAPQPVSPDTEYDTAAAAAPLDVDAAATVAGGAAPSPDVEDTELVDLVPAADWNAPTDEQLAAFEAELLGPATPAGLIEEEPSEPGRWVYTKRVSDPGQHLAPGAVAVEDDDASTEGPAEDYAEPVGPAEDGDGPRKAGLGGLRARRSAAAQTRADRAAQKAAARQATAEAKARAKAEEEAAREEARLAAEAELAEAERLRQIEAERAAAQARADQIQRELTQAAEAEEKAALEAAEAAARESERTERVARERREAQQRVEDRRAQEERRLADARRREEEAAAAQRLTEIARTERAAGEQEAAAAARALLEDAAAHASDGAPARDVDRVVGLAAAAHVADRAGAVTELTHEAHDLPEPLPPLVAA